MTLDDKNHKNTIKTTSVISIASVLSVIVAVGIISNVSTFSSDQSPANGAMMLTGNVIATHLDGNGNVIGLRQSDNHIVGQGMEMIISQVFNQMNGTADAFTRPVSHMEIGHTGEWELLMNDTDLRAPADSTVPACVRVAATFSNVTGPSGQGFGGSSIVRGVQGGSHSLCNIANWASESGGPNSADCSAQANVTAQAQFTGANCAGVLTIDEAGMFNDVSSGTMFARNNFGGVVLNAPDTLQLDWEFSFTDS